MALRTERMQTLDQVRDFLDGNETADFVLPDRAPREPVPSPWFDSTPTDALGGLARGQPWSPPRGLTRTPTD